MGCALARAVAWYGALGISALRILTENGGGYRSVVLATAALALGVGQRFTRSYRPQTNGKAERVIRTLLAEWAYARAYGRSCWRTHALPHHLSFLQHRAARRRAPVRSADLTRGRQTENDDFVIYS